MANPWFVVLDFVAGVFLVWLYAAIRPRSAPGPHGSQGWGGCMVRRQLLVHAVHVARRR